MLILKLVKKGKKKKKKESKITKKAKTSGFYIFITFDKNDITG